ncbi:MAG: hypothetical protein CVU65_04265, partial [Deltaproteobacteria bacterium HGW-Deltaproteobacteria-22]
MRQVIWRCPFPTYSSRLPQLLCFLRYLPSVFSAVSLILFSFHILLRGDHMGPGESDERRLDKKAVWVPHEWLVGKCMFLSAQSMKPRRFIMRRMLMLTILLGFVASCRGEEDGSMPRRTVQSDLPITKVVLY